MSMTLTFDTLQFVQRLKKAGIKETEAEALAEAVRDAQANADLATKQDIATVQRDIADIRKDTLQDGVNLRQDIQQDFADVRKDIAFLRKDVEVKIAETKADLIRWVVSVGILQTAMVAALLLKLLPVA